MPVTRAMLMAAGLGTRMRPFTDAEPKALLPLMGVPIAQFALDSLSRAGAELVVANVHHHAARAREGLLALEARGARVEISDESSLLLGSAGGIRKALPRFEGKTFFYVNADVLCDLDPRGLARTHEELRSRWGISMTLAVFPEPPAGGSYREIFLDPRSGLVTGFSQEPRRGRPFFASMAVLEPEALRGVPSEGPADFRDTILEPEIRARRVGYHLVPGGWRRRWMDIGSPDLWLGGHLDLIQALEAGRLSPRWRERLESFNHRIASGIWVARAALARSKLMLRSHASGWSGPCYFSGEHPPRELGPRAILYGEPAAGVRLAHGAGFAGFWSGSD